VQASGSPAEKKGRGGETHVWEVQKKKIHKKIPRITPGRGGEGSRLRSNAKFEELFTRKQEGEGGVGPTSIEKKARSEESIERAVTRFERRKGKQNQAIFKRTKYLSVR